MNLYEAKRLGQELMVRHGLVGWKFVFDHARRRFGACRIREKIISLSKPLAFLNNEEQVRDTILHEIAHALTPGDGHGAKWQAKCREIGAIARRCYQEEEVVAPPQKAAQYMIGCKRCGWWAERRRISGRKLICKKCRQGIVYRDRASGEEISPGRKSR